jgi:hypothetical protein
MDLVVYDPDLTDLVALADWASVQGHEVSGIFLTATDCIARCRRSLPEAVFVSGLYRSSDEGLALVATLSELGVPLMVAGVGLVPGRFGPPGTGPATSNPGPPRLI